ncbi:MAG: type IX secretion system outer membrane channel protein PorV [Flavobacteriales bacterium]|nr:type IX secretion system outer membrane channel protein PorV [Flavobacteriales bacterium]MDG1779683.1 type IX secretion system outer membrane channel protein PorV [Flavobacteriales bacterium]MDG2245619.1 type IX secretion system outer membrane channel protein PorV [Flavobacteriales bacterium]
MTGKVLIASALALFACLNVDAQLNNQNTRAQQVQLNTLTTAVPFLMIAPDSRSGGIGDAGVALSADASSIHWNPAKMAFAKNEFEMSMSYSPWLRKLVNDMNLAYLSGYKKLNKNQAIGGALRFFSLGEITFTDESGTAVRNFKPAEFSLDVAFSQRLSERFSGGIAARFVNSNLTGGTPALGADTKPGRSVAVDVSAFYTNDDIELGSKDGILNFGLNISNIGAKMSYTETAERDFIPANLRLGTALTLILDEYNQLTFTLDANKLLVPTPPVYSQEDGSEIVSGYDPNVGVATAIVQSFYDAPGIVTFDENNNPSVEAGSVLREELREINLGGGMEYVYDNQFAFRTGYFYEHYTKGNRQFMTLGAGLKYTTFAIDLSYLISTTQQNPLANTLRFSLRLEFENLKNTGRSEG